MIKAIETEYQGYRFRSRLEARWSVFFNVLGIEWEYEKEGFDLDGIWYLPDFWLTNVSLRGNDPGMWLEIKGENPTDEEILRGELLGKGSRHGVAIAVGLPSPEQRDNGIFQLWPHWDNWMHFMRCYYCDFTKIDLESPYCTCPNCGKEADDQHPAIAIASDLARAARFEYGEQPIIPAVKELQDMCTEVYLNRAQTCLDNANKALHKHGSGPDGISIARRINSEATKWLDLAR